MDPNDSTQSAAADALSQPDQNAVDAALNAYQQASSNFNYWQQKAQDLQSDPKADTSALSSANAQADSARSQLGSAARDYSNLLGRIAIARENNARMAKDPNEQRLWANEADKARFQGDLYSAEADMYRAKTQADIDNATTRANAALSRAQTAASRVTSQNDASDAQAMLARAKAVQVPALSADIVRVHNSTIQRNQEYVTYLQSREAVSGSQVDLNEAKAQLIQGPQAQAMLSKAELDKVKAAGLDLTQGATLEKIQAAAGLSDARTKQIAANISKWQVLPYNDRTNPTLVEFQPSTGQMVGQPNPGYVNTQLQGINDTQAAIQNVQNQIASGQMTPDEGTALINNLRQALQYKALGVTPDQYIQAQQQQAQLGMGILNNYMGTINKGQDVANNFLSVASKIRNMPAGMNFTPFSTMGQIANNVYGPDLAKAHQLISQVQPVSDQFSALKNIALLSQAKQSLQDHIQQNGGGTPSSQGGTDQVQQVTDQAGGQNPTAGVLPQQTDLATQSMLTPFAQSGLPEGR